MAVIPHPTKSRTEPGRWWYIDVGRGKERQRVPFEGSYEDAVRLYQELATNKRPQAALLPTLGEMVVPFLEWYQHEAAPATMQDVRLCLNRHIIPALGKWRPDQLGQTILDGFRTQLVQNGASPRTINKVLSYLSTLIKWGVASGVCKDAPGKMPRFSRRKTVSEPPTPLSAAQVDAVYAALPPRFRLAFLLMADHGLRREEALSLQFSDIDVDHKMIHVLGKGNKRRHVPFMSARFEEELAQVLANAGQNPTGPLTINPCTGRAYLNIRKTLRQAAKTAGVPVIGHHLLRHTFAALMAARGMSPYVLQHLLGHSSQETTNKIYVHIGEDFVAEEARRLSTVLAR